MQSFVTGKTAILHTNVEVLVWKPPRLEVVASETGVPYTTFALQGGDVHLKLTPQHLGEIVTGCNDPQYGVAITLALSFGYSYLTC